jgi:Protein of unknown function (DUF3426)
MPGQAYGERPRAGGPSGAPNLAARPMAPGGKPGAPMGGRPPMPGQGQALRPDASPGKQNGAAARGGSPSGGLPEPGFSGYPNPAGPGAARQGDGAAMTDADFGADASFDAFGEDDRAGPGLPSQMVVDPRLGPDQRRLAAPVDPNTGPSRGRGPVLIAGWAALILLVVIVAGAFVSMPRTVAAALPGAARLYGAMGIPMGGPPLAFRNVHYVWNTDKGQTMLEIEGNIVNTTDKPMTVPNVLIRLLDKDGNKISEWMSPADAKPLAAGAKAAFATQIPSPPPTVRGFKVHFQQSS